MGSRVYMPEAAAGSRRRRVLTTIFRHVRSADPTEESNLLYHSFGGGYGRLWEVGRNKRKSGTGVVVVPPGGGVVRGVWLHSQELAPFSRLMEGDFTMFRS